MLAEVDQAPQSSKQFEAGLAREQQGRIQSEEAAAQTLEAGRRLFRDTQHSAQQVERELCDRFADQAGLLAQAQFKARRCSSAWEISSGSSAKKGNRTRTHGGCFLATW